MCQSHQEGAPGSQGNGKGMENSREKVQGLCFVPWTKGCCKGVVLSMLTAALQRQQNLEVAQCPLVQDLIDGLRYKQ